MDEQRPQNDAERASGGDADALQRLLVHCHEPLYRAVAQSRSAALANRIDPDDILQQAYVTAFRMLCASPDDDDVAASDNPAADDDAAQPSAATKGGAGVSPVEAPPNPKSSPAAPPRFENTGHFYKWLEAVALSRLRDAERDLRRQKRDVAREVSPAASPSGSYPNLLHQLSAADQTPSREVAQAEAVAAVMSSLARLPDKQRDVIRWRLIDGVSFAEIAQRLDKSEDATYMLCHRGLKTLRGLLGTITRYLTKL